VVKRYDFNGYDVCKDEAPDGDYVSYEDYEKLEKENEKLISQIEYLEDYISDEKSRHK